MLSDAFEFGCWVLTYRQFAPALAEIGERERGRNSRRESVTLDGRIFAPSQKSKEYINSLAAHCRFSTSFPYYFSSSLTSFAWSRLRCRRRRRAPAATNWWNSLPISLIAISPFEAENQQHTQRQTDGNTNKCTYYCLTHSRRRRIARTVSQCAPSPLLGWGY